MEAASAAKSCAICPVQMARPDDEEVEKTKAETAAALGLVVNSKIAAAQPKTLPQQPGAPTYIKYTPTQQGPQYNSGASQRIIKMQVRKSTWIMSPLRYATLGAVAAAMLPSTVSSQ
jgi:hypothetical protein